MPQEFEAHDADGSNKYTLIEEGILKYPTLTSVYATLWGSVVLVLEIVALVASFLLNIPIFPETGPTLAGSLLFVLPFVPATIWIAYLERKRRRQKPPATLEDVLKNKLVKFVPWTEVSSVRFEGRYLTVMTPKEKYRMLLKFPDETDTFVRRILGERVSAQTPLITNNLTRGAKVGIIGSALILGVPILGVLGDHPGLRTYLLLPLLLLLLSSPIAVGYGLGRIADSSGESRMFLGRSSMDSFYYIWFGMTYFGSLAARVPLFRLNVIPNFSIPADPIGLDLYVAEFVLLLAAGLPLYLSFREASDITGSRVFKMAAVVFLLLVPLYFLISIALFPIFFVLQLVGFVFAARRVRNF